MNLQRLKLKHQSSSEDVFRLRQRSFGGSDRVIFNPDPDCIFCNKEGRKSIKRKGSWTTEAISMFEFNGSKKILDVVNRYKDEKHLTRIRQ